MILFRKMSHLLEKILSVLRVILIKIKYPSVKITFNSYVGKNCQIHCDNNSRIFLNKVHLANGVVLEAKRGGQISIIKSYIGFNSVIVSIDSISIGENVEIAEMVVLRDQNHNFDFTSTPISIQGFNYAPIFIGNNTWVGAKATILKGVSIGENCLIGAHSLVNKGSFPDGCLIVGSPAKIIASSKSSHKVD